MYVRGQHTQDQNQRCRVLATLLCDWGEGKLVEEHDVDDL